MISFEMLEEEKIAQETVRRFATDVLRPAARDSDEESTLPEEILEALWSLGIAQEVAVNPETERKSQVMNAIIMEELAYGDASMAFALGAPMAFLNAVADYGTQAQKDAMFPKFAGNDYRASAIAFGEGVPNWSLETLKTKATKSSEGLTLNGVKKMVPLAERCEYFLVIAGSDAGPVACIVPKDADGLTIKPESGTLGLRAVGFGTIELAEVQVPANMVLGEGGAASVQAMIDSSRVALGAIQIGISRSVFDYVVPYAKERIVHRQYLAQKQTVAFWFADMKMEIEAMRWMVWKGASMLRNGEDVTKQAHLTHAYNGEKGLWITDHGIQTLGGHGFIREHPVELWYRHSRSASLLEACVAV